MRDSSPPRASFTEGVARRVVEACQSQDPGARITYVGIDPQQRTRVRVRTGGCASVQALQRALSKLMPYATVRTSEDVLDGSAQAEIVVPTKTDERALAKRVAAGRLLSRTLNWVACVLFLAAAALWAADTVLAMNGMGAGAADI